MLSLIIIGLASFLAGSEGAAVGRCGIPNTYTYDDQNCRTYYICTRNGWVPGTCRNNQYFNPNLPSCVPQKDYICPYDSSTTARGCSRGTCLNGGWCVPSLDGQGQCRCPSGFDGNRCQNVVGGGSSDSSSATNTTTAAVSCIDLTCLNGGSCVQKTPTRAECYCPGSFGGPLCETKLTNHGICPVTSESTCDPACENGGKCFEENGKSKCFCPEGFNGDTCELTLDACTVKDCQNGGECTFGADGKVACTCPEPYSGERCEHKVTAACWALQCQNNAPCRRVGSAIQCDCPDGFIGDHCQYEDPCPNITCLHGGKCESGDIGEATCNCPVGYIGSFCEIARDCETFTCYNGGECKIQNNKRVCICPDRTAGDRCEKKLICHGDGLAPCENGGKCVNSEDGFVCICPLGRKGLFCEELRTCSENIVCENGGTCNDTASNGSKCVCKSGFSGPRCEVAKDDCGGCENGGICQLPPLLPVNSPVSDKVCACPAGFAGDHCETETSCTTPCPVSTGASGERYHTFVYPDVEKKDYIYLCRMGRLSHVKYCDDGLWYDPFAMECHSEGSFAAARQLAGEALYPNNFPEKE